MKPNKPEPTEKMLESNKTKLSFQPTGIVSNPGEYILQTGVSQLCQQGELAAFTDVTLVKKDLFEEGGGGGEVHTDGFSVTLIR